MLDTLKVILFGIVEGITEWLPISSTGHMILLEEFITLNVRREFWDIFLVVIQLGAILAVVWINFNQLNPFSPSKSQAEKEETWMTWFKSSRWVSSSCYCRSNIRLMDGSKLNELVCCCSYVNCLRYLVYLD